MRRGLSLAGLFRSHDPIPELGRVAVPCIYMVYKDGSEEKLPSPISVLIAVRATGPCKSAQTNPHAIRELIPFEVIPHLFFTDPLFIHGDLVTGLFPHHDFQCGHKFFLHMNKKVSICNIYIHRSVLLFVLMRNFLQ